MFKDVFKTQITEFKPKRSDGDLRLSITLSGVLTSDMAKDLGKEVEDLLVGDLQFKSITVDEVLDGLILNFWHDGQDANDTDGPILHLTRVSTKKYKLTVVPMPRVILISITFQTASLTEQEFMGIARLYEYQVQVQIDQMQQAIDFDNSGDTGDVE